VFRGGNNGVAYRTDPVTLGDVQQTITATGTVNPVTTVQVGTQVSERSSSFSPISIRG